MDECFAVLVSEYDPCSRVYIPIDCICAIISPARTTQSGGGHGGGCGCDWE